MTVPAMTPAMRPHEAVIVFERRLRAGAAIRREAELLLALADAQEAEALSEVGAALGAAAADMALAFVRMAGDPVEAGHADIEAIPGLLGRMLPSWLGPDAIRVVAGGHEGGGQPHGTGTAVVGVVAHARVMPAPDGDRLDAGPVPCAQPDPVPAGGPGTPPDAPVAETPAPPVAGLPGPAAAVDGAPQVIPTYRADRPLTEAERKVILDSLTAETFDHERLADHMRLLRPKGTTVEPWVALPPFPRTGKDKDVTYLDVKVRANQRHELQEIVHDALYIAQAGRSADLCVLYDKCMGYGVWRRKVFRAVIVHETGLELPPPKSANARQRRSSSDGPDDAATVPVIPTPGDDPVDAVQQPATMSGGSGGGAAGPSGVAADASAVAQPREVPAADLRVDALPLPQATHAPALAERHPLIVGQGQRDVTGGDDPDLLQPDHGFENPDEYDPRDHVAQADGDHDDDDAGHGDADHEDADDEADDGIDGGYGDADDPDPSYHPGRGRGDPVTREGWSTAAAGGSTMRLGLLDMPRPDTGSARPPPRTVFDELPPEVARRHGLLPPLPGAASPPAADRAGAGPVPVGNDAIRKPDGAIQRVAAGPPHDRVNEGSASPTSRPAWVPTPPGVRADGNLPPLDPSTLGPSPFPRVGPPPFDFGLVYKTGVRAEAGYEQAFVDARANRPITPPPPNAMGG